MYPHSPHSSLELAQNGQSSQFSVAATVACAHMQAQPRTDLRPAGRALCAPRDEECERAALDTRRQWTRARSRQLARRGRSSLKARARSRLPPKHLKCSPSSNNPAARAPPQRAALRGGGSARLASPRTRPRFLAEVGAQLGRAHASRLRSSHGRSHAGRDRASAGAPAGAAALGCARGTRR